MRSLGSYFGLGPTEHLYIDTSQGLLGFGAAEGAPSSEMITIYEGVGGLGGPRGMMGPNRVSVGGLGGGCGCQAQRGRLAGFGRFGDEVPPDGTLPPVSSVGVTLGTNIQTGLVALLAAASLAVVGAVVFGKLQGQPLRANSRRVGTRSMPTRRKGAIWVTSYCNRAHSLKTGRPIRHQCVTLSPAALRAERDELMRRNGTRPRLRSGYAYELRSHPSRWRSSSSERWEVVMNSRGAKTAVFLGTRSVDGTRVNVFQTKSGRVFAQTAHG